MSYDQKHRAEDQESRTVHPRTVWVGLALALAGAAVLGLGVAVESWWWAVAGAVLLAVGAGTGIRGGGLYDVHSGSPGQELEQVVEGETHQGVAPGDTVRDERARATSRDLDQRREALIAASHEAPRPPLAQLGAILVLLVAVFLLVAQWKVYPLGAQSQTNGLWSLGSAIVAGLAGLRIVVGQPGRHLPSALLIVLAGGGLVPRASLATHETAATAITEGVCGVLLLLGGAIALASPATRDG